MLQQRCEYVNPNQINGCLAEYNKDGWRHYLTTPVADDQFKRVILFFEREIEN